MIGFGSRGGLAQEQPEVRDLVERGRALLAAEKPDEAEQLFIEAEVLSGKLVTVRKWIWRAWMQEGRINDALDAVDAIEPAGELPQTDLDYLRGMAFFFRGRTYVAQNVGEPFTSDAFRDATEWLAAATRADPETYHDAWLALAECAWQSHEYDIGRAAAEEALRRFPADARGALLLGRILFQRYLELSPDPGAKEAADGVFAELVAVLERALAILGTPEDVGERMLVADAWLQLGYAWERVDRTAESVRAFAEAIALWPGGIDFDDLWGRFDREDFSALIESAADKSAVRFPPDAAEDAQVWWWLGTARFARETWPEAAEAFELAARKWPAYVEAWYWSARARARASDLAAAVAALREGWRADPAVIAKKLREGGTADRAFVDELIGWTAREQRTDDREVLQAVRARAWPD